MKATTIPKQKLMISLQHFRMSAASGSHCRMRGPNIQTMAVASPPTGAAATNVVKELAVARQANSAVPSTAPSAFLALGVDPMLAAALPSIDVMRPSPIQTAALPTVLSGANCAIQSYTGSGKTLSYLLPALTLALRRAEKLAADPATPRRGGVPDVPVQVLVVAPSQELAMQIVRVAKSLMPHDVGRYAVQQVIGGANPKRQAEALAMVPGPLIVVGTPGRLAEMIRSGSLRLHHCGLMVLDEADQLLASAFAEDINHINEHCGKRVSIVRPGDTSTAGGSSIAGGALASVRRQTVLVSATLTPSVLNRAARWCPEPQFVSAGAVPGVMAAGQAAEGGGKNPSWGWGVRGWDGPASDFAPKIRGSAGGVESDELIPTMPPQLAHYYIVVEPRHKVDALRRAIHALKVQRALVFMNFQQRLQDAQFKLQARGMKAAALHGELPRLARANLLNDFRRGRLRALVVSDVAARGIDVPSCDAVFHLELPSSAAHYAHRAGRTGRLSAALAAQAAAEAATAAAAAAAQLEVSDTAQAAQPLPPMRPSAKDEFIEQAAGTVVTIVSPSERFVVDKLAAQLGVPLLEAHVSHGQLRLGPPPGGYSFQKDDESDRTEDTNSSGQTPRQRERKAEGSGASEAGRRDAGAEASTSGRASSALVPAPSSHSTPVAAKVASKKAASTPSKDDEYDIIVDEDDNIILEEDDEDDDADYEILDEDLQAFKRLRPSEIRKLGAGVTTAATGVGATGIKLKAQRMQRVLPPGLEPGRSGGRDNRGTTQTVAGKDQVPAALSARQAGQLGEKKTGQDLGPEESSSRRFAVSRTELMRELHRELEELRTEKDREKQGARWRGGKGAKSL
ncbi:hypothetical protein Vretimale_8409 [Volvox reticuliferus]|uniref:Uncharacterized protein n=1 Tax=Volvox reticuliferus TaxID=1737510 RepID=A0A8J4CKQ5_9CHLO|nr:hypothetical protein Vretifemale_11810 [Volvox reticuliferus]GIM03744.1 hypothetical protein Vretimale_8409 [Volvox reticuliferus]